MFRIHEHNLDFNPKPDPNPTTNHKFVDSEHGIITDIYITIKNKWGQIDTYQVLAVFVRK